MTIRGQMPELDQELSCATSYNLGTQNTPYNLGLTHHLCFSLVLNGFNDHGSVVERIM